MRERNVETSEEGLKALYYEVEVALKFEAVIGKDGL
jgi:hypothetical protein